MDILIKNMEMPKDEGVFIIIDCNGTIQKQIGMSGKRPIYRLEDKATAIQLPDHGDLADKRTIIERMGDAHDELFDKVDSKALSECHIAFLKAVMYAPTVIPSTDSAMVLERTT